MNKLKAAMQDHLVRDILPYWMQKTIDLECGGFYGRIDGSNTLHPKADKGCILNARIMWTFSAAYNLLKKEEYLDISQRAFEYFIENFIDKEYGGVFWMLDCCGKPKDTKKQIYAQSFAIYGLAEYYKASKNPRALEEAKKLFDLTERYAFDREDNGYFEAYDRQWVLLEDLRLSEKDANEKKTMNTHLHILEAYTTLYGIWPDKKLKDQLKNLVVLFKEKFLGDSLSFHLFFDEQWNVKSDEISFGHDIEGSWLIQEAAEALGEADLIEQSKTTAVAMTDLIIKKGFDRDGGLMYEADHNGITDSDKHWWPQAEALVGLVNVYQSTGKEMYLQKAEAVWNFVQSKIIDSVGGEWFFRVNKEGRPYIDEDKVGPWKCPYHNGRACLEIIKRL